MLRFLIWYVVAFDIVVIVIVGFFDVFPVFGILRYVEEVFFSNHVFVSWDPDVRVDEFECFILEFVEKFEIVLGWLEIVEKIFELKCSCGEVD